MLHSPEYRRRYVDFLKSDFPRVQVTGNRDLFAGLVALGRRLVDLHMMDVDAGGGPSFPVEGDNRVEKVRYVRGGDSGPGRVKINPRQWFEGVAPETWGFELGGYRPAEKWLKEQKGRELSFDDVSHYRRLCAALVETGRLAGEIDDLIGKHGGWPLAPAG